jgi:hypothetical protein
VQIKRALSTPTFYHSDKTKAQLFGSWLKQWNLLEKDVILYEETVKHSIIFLSGWWYSVLKEHRRINGRIATLHTSGQWRQFIDSSKVSLKALLLHNGNKAPFYPTDSCSSHVRNVQEPSGFAAKNTLWRTLVQCMCWPKSYSNADWAARWMH